MPLFVSTSKANLFKSSSRRDMEGRYKECPASTAKEISSPISPASSTGILKLTLRRIRLNESVKNVSIKVTIGAKSLKTIECEYSEQRQQLTLNKTFHEPVTFHSYLFDSLKVYVISGGFPVKSRVGRAKLRLFKTPVTSEGVRRNSISLPLVSEKENATVGAVSISAGFEWDAPSPGLAKFPSAPSTPCTPNIASTPSSPRTPTLPTLFSSVSGSSSLESIWQSSSNSGSSSSVWSMASSYSATEDIAFDYFSDYTESLVDISGDPEGVETGTIVIKYSDIQPETGMVDYSWNEEDHSDDDYDGSLQSQFDSATIISGPPSLQSTVSIESSTRSTDSIAKISTGETATSKRPPPLRIENNGIKKDKKVRPSPIVASLNFLDSTIDSSIFVKMNGFHSDDIKYTKFDAIKELFRIASTFFGEGWKMNATDFAASLKLLIKYQDNREIGRPLLSKSTPLMDFKRISYFHDVYQFALSSYGWLGLNALGFRNGITGFSNLKAISKHLNLKEDDMLIFEMSQYMNGNSETKTKWHGDSSGWRVEYDNASVNWESGAVCKPCFFVAKCDALDAIVVCVRGTMSLSDALTDLICHYVPFRGGLAHQGFLHSGGRLHGYLLPYLKTLIEKFKPKRLIITGHSMGGATANILAILLNDNIDELRNLSGHNDEFSFSCVCYGTPPVLTRDVGDKYKNLITNIQFDLDIVCRLSYGSAMDLKELLAASADELNCIKDKLGIFSDSKLAESFEKLDAKRRRLQKYGTNPKLDVPGRIYHLKQSTSQSTYFKATSFEAKASDEDSPTAGSFGSRLNQGSRKVILTNKRRPHMELWKVDTSVYREIVPHRRCIWDHLPQVYDDALVKAKLWALELSS
ncbi:hypothetical protein BKA69DRAFT_1128455 [Paraphysoderma sedebokerense]|nr:hypothetical protein BKA69DRAFT_1128455 [Paraphysoderma sedebokerense]